MQQVHPLAQTTFTDEIIQNGVKSKNIKSLSKDTKKENNHINTSPPTLISPGFLTGETSEWVLFDNIPSVNGKCETIHGDSDNLTDDLEVEKDSILSTISNRESYVINDFDIISDDEVDVDVDGYYDDEGDDDSLINVVRDEMNNLIGLKLNDTKEKQRNELVDKINNWIKGLSGIENKTYNHNKINSTYEIKKKKKFFSDKTKMAKTIIEIYHLKKAIGIQEINNSQLKEFKRILNKLNTALIKTDDFQHEGIFMNNPDLESCIPGNWKNMMLDNLINTNYDKNNIIYNMGNVAIDDIKNKNNETNDIKDRNFWQRDESLSTQSISTGWDGIGNL